MKRTQFLLLVGCLVAWIWSPPSATALECGQQVGGQVVLDADLDCDGTALVVARPRTILQLNGHTITGRAVCQRQPREPGVRIAPVAENAQILGPGAIRGFAHGVLVDGASDVLVRDTVITENCGSGILAADALRLNLVQNVIFKNGSDFVEPAAGIFLGASDNSLIERNAIFMNGPEKVGAGLRLVSSSQAEIRMNHLTGNSGDGIVLDQDSADNRVERNVVLGSGGEDIVDRGAVNVFPLNLAEKTSGVPMPALLPLPAFPERTTSGIVGCGTMHALIDPGATATVSCPQEPEPTGLMNSVVSYRLLNPLRPQLRFPGQCDPAVVSRPSSTNGGAVTCTNPNPIWRVILEVRCCLS